MSDRVIRAIKQAFAYLDPEETGYVSLERLFSTHRPEDHPHTETRKKFFTEIQNEFTNSISVKSSDGKRLSEK